MRLNEKTYKASIKTSMLGKDAAKSEYWHFKDDCGRIYIRMENEVPNPDAKLADVSMVDHAETNLEEGKTADDLALNKESTQVESTSTIVQSKPQPETTMIDTMERKPYQPIVEEDNL